MNEKSLRVLEYNKIIDLLKKKASSSLGLKYIENLVPNTDFVEVKSMLEETSEAQSIIIKRGSVGKESLYRCFSWPRKSDYDSRYLKSG